MHNNLQIQEDVNSQIALTILIVFMNRSGVLVPPALYHTAQVLKVRFSALTADQIEVLSTMEVTQSKLYDGPNPTKGGVNDPKMGIIKPGQKCETCLESKDCQGHFGHVKLAEPVFHVGFLKYVEKILKCICHNCSKLKYFGTDQQRDKFQQIMHITQPEKRLNQLVGLLGPIAKCPLANEDGARMGCGSYIPTKIIIKEKMRLLVVEKEDKKNYAEAEYSALKVKAIFEKISEDERKILGFTQSKPVDLLISVLAVAPPQIRPSVELGPQKRAEDDITNAYCRIVALNNQILEGMDSYRRGLNLKEIQKLIASIMVKLDNKYLPALKEKAFRRRRTAKKIKSLEERLVAKEGRFRQHLMGKRVDFSARSVIGPDSHLALDEVGVPERIAQSVTIPQEINEFNFEKIVDLCKKGHVKYLLQPQIGKRSPNFIYLNNLQSPQDIEKYVTYGTIAERQLQNGDYVLFNRQPTLHRMSMMAHRVRILPLNTFRLNLSVCSPYNADFDGDEMNMHVPQSIEAIAQLKHIAHVPKQVISPKNSTPVMGIVQDSLLGIFLLTKRDTFLTREEFMNLIIWIEPMSKFSPGDLPMPCILKPTPLWSGKQVMSYLIPQKLSIKFFRREEGMRNVDDRSGLLIRRGQLLSGALQREHVGPGSGGLVHAIWLEIGADATNDFITNAQRIVTAWLMNNSFSVGAVDVMIDEELVQLRRGEVDKIKEDYFKNLHMFRNLPCYINENLHQKGKKVADSLEFKINLDLNNALSRMQRILLDRISVHTNNIYKMITARSKGSETNLVQIMFCLGNQNVDGRRCPLGFSRRALPHFSKDDNSPEPRGFVFSSFFKGLKPHEFFFHSMAGREGLSDTAVKTSSIGYIQRKLVKALEDLSIRYDGTVRDSQNNVLQRSYGEDGFQPEFIERHTFNDCKLSEFAFRSKYTWNLDQLQEKGYSKVQLDKIRGEYSGLLEARLQFRSRLLNKGDGDDIQYHCPINILRLVNKINEEGWGGGEVIHPVRAVELIQELTKQCMLPQFKKEYDSLMTNLSMQRDNGSLSMADYYLRKDEFMRQSGMQVVHTHLKIWLCSTKICLQYRLTQPQLIKVCQIIKMKFKQALAPCGEAIGSLAAQSIGEPTTQMTLNTFHLAGVSDKNVTLGIPRLRQLLDVSKNIKTPYMTVYYHRPLLWEHRNTQEMGYIQNIILSMLPERHIKDCLSSSSIYFDSGEFSSNIDGLSLEEGLRSTRTQWVLSLKFQIEKITSASIWRIILNSLKDKYSKEYDIVEYVGIGEEGCPEIHLRLNAETSARIGSQNAYKHISQREIELKEIFLSGMKGIKSIKTARRISYRYEGSEQISLSLDHRSDELIFDAVGSNLKECLANGYIDPVKTTSNDLNEIYHVLGIEAARQCFMHQIKEILKPYSIYINNRHLAVLADWMSTRGSLTPINRHGINRVRDVSVLRKASFEQTVDILYGAAVFSEVDQLRGVSERIIFGEKMNLGTNTCEIYVDAEKIANYIYQPMAIIPSKLGEEEMFYNNAQERGMMTPKGLETPQLTFASSQYHQSSSPKDRSSPYASSPSYEVKQRVNSREKKTANLSISPSYHREEMSELGDLQMSANYSSPTYHFTTGTSNQTQSKAAFANESSKSPSYDKSQFNISKTALQTSMKSPQSSLVVNTQEAIRPQEDEFEDNFKQDSESSGLEH